MIGNKNSDKITKVSKTSLYNNSDIVPNEEGLGREIPREKYMSKEETQKFIDDLRLI